MSTYDARMGPLSPEQQLKILAEIWGDREGDHVFLPWIPGNAKSKEERKRSWNEGPAFPWPEKEPRILQHLIDHKEDDLYFSVNTFAGESRIAQYAGEEICLWADLDEVNPDEDIDRSMRPTIAWESSPGRFQAVWLMDSMMPGASEPGGINHRLTAAIGADPSGWDVTQLLRVPGRPNFKPEYRENGKPAPGQLLWINKKQYSWDHFEDLPEVYTFDLEGSEIEERELGEIDRRAVWQRVRLKCSSLVRSYMSMRERDINSDEHDRSEILWQIERDLADAGCSILEIVALVRASVWNKHAGRRNEISQLRTEAIKAKSVTESDKEDQPLESTSALQPSQLTWFSDLAAQPIPRPNWLVHNIWAAGSVGFISGEPKSYKSYVGLDMALSVAIGQPFLNDPQFPTGKPRKVLYLQEEDTLPLIMHRAAQIIDGKSPNHHWHGTVTMRGESRDEQGDSASADISDVFWDAPTRIDTLAMQVRSGFVASDPVWQSWLADQVMAEEIALVVIDTMGTTLGDIDSDKAAVLNERILKPLKIISETAGCAIAIIHHNRKSSSDNARAGQSMLGSVAFHAWVESALYVRSKETDKSGINTVKIERENKLAQDFKFRMMVPTMFTDNGEGDGDRQVWEPEIRVGWGDDEDHEKDYHDFPKHTTAGEKILPILRDLGAVADEDGASVTLSMIFDEYVKKGGHKTQRQNVRDQLNRAARRGLIEGDHETGWLIV